MAENQILTNEMLDARLNGSIDDIPDLPDFANLSLGIFRLVGTKAEHGMTKGKPPEGMISFQFDVKETIEIADASKTPVIGSKTSFRYSGEYGIQKFKKVFLDAIKSANCENIAQFMDRFADLEFIVKIKEREVTNKETGKVTVYAEIETLVLG